MEPGIYVGLLAFILGLVIGLPIVWVFLGSSLTMLFFLGSPFTFIAGTFYHSLDSYVLMAIGFFILAGSLMADSGIAEKIVFLSNILVGKIRGGNDSSWHNSYTIS